MRVNKHGSPVAFAVLGILDRFRERRNRTANTDGSCREKIGSNAEKFLCRAPLTERNANKVMPTPQAGYKIQVVENRLWEILSVEDQEWVYRFAINKESLE